MADPPTLIPLRSGLPAIRVDPAIVDWPAAHERAWQELRTENDRFSDAPIWSAVRWSESELVVRPDRYQRLAVQRRPGIGDLGVFSLGVKTLTTAPNPDGRDRVLLAARSAATRTYPSMWDLAPAGGVDADTPLTQEAILDTVIHEAAEELAIDCRAQASSLRPLALLPDPIASSLEVIIHLPLPVTVAVKPNWEATAVHWFTRDQCRALSQQPHLITPPTLAVLRWQGWL